MNDRIRTDAALDMERAAYLGRTIDLIFGPIDPGMRVRSDLIRSGLPIDKAGNAIVENDE
jgi:hypothetical protein